MFYMQHHRTEKQLLVAEAFKIHDMLDFLFVDYFWRAVL